MPHMSGPRQPAARGEDARPEACAELLQQAPIGREQGSRGEQSARGDQRARDARQQRVGRAEEQHDGGGQQGRPTEPEDARRQPTPPRGVESHAREKQGQDAKQEKSHEGLSFSYLDIRCHGLTRISWLL